MGSELMCDQNLFYDHKSHEILFIRAEFILGLISVNIFVYISTSYVNLKIKNLRNTDE